MMETRSIDKNGAKESGETAPCPRKKQQNEAGKQEKKSKRQRKKERRQQQQQQEQKTETSPNLHQSSRTPAGVGRKRPRPDDEPKGSNKRSKLDADADFIALDDSDEVSQDARQIRKLSKKRPSTAGLQGSDPRAMQIKNHEMVKLQNVFSHGDLRDDLESSDALSQMLFIRVDPSVIRSKKPDKSQGGRIHRGTLRRSFYRHLGFHAGHAIEAICNLTAEPKEIAVLVRLAQNQILEQISRAMSDSAFTVKDSHLVISTQRYDPRFHTKERFKYSRAKGNTKVDTSSIVTGRAFRVQKDLQKGLLRSEDYEGFKKDTEVKIPASGSELPQDTNAEWSSQLPGDDQQLVVAQNGSAVVIPLSAAHVREALLQSHDHDNSASRTNALNRQDPDSACAETGELPQDKAGARSKENDGHDEILDNHSSSQQATIERDVKEAFGFLGIDPQCSDSEVINVYRSLQGKLLPEEIVEAIKALQRISEFRNSTQIEQAIDDVLATDDVASYRSPSPYNSSTPPSAPTTPSDEEAPFPPPESVAQSGSSKRSRLCDISELEAQLQARYWGITGRDEYVRCPVCAGQGHMDEDCLEHVCKHCGSIGQHYDMACPKWKKCRRCRERGHDVLGCPSKLARTRAEGYDCDLCGRSGHAEEECSWLWRSLVPERMSAGELADLPKLEKMVVSCYDCGSNKHWGDDCPVPSNFRRTADKDTWSAEFANYFLKISMPTYAVDGPRTSKGPKALRGPGSSIKRNRDFTVSDDEDGDPMSAFYGRKVETLRPQKARIQISSTSFSNPSADRFPPPPSYNQDYSYHPPDRGSYNGRNTVGKPWQPPLPSEPLPSRPPSPRALGGARGWGGRGGLSREPARPVRGLGQPPLGRGAGKSYIPGY